jgi:putative oxidoreductase
MTQSARWLAWRGRSDLHFGDAICRKGAGEHLRFAMKFLHLNFLPRSSDTALLLLRIWHGGALLVLHGWGKLASFSSMAPNFVDPFGIGKTPSLALAVFGEVVCSALLILGLFTRVAALGCAITMATAFWFAHGARLTGQNSGEMAFLLLGVYLALFIAGAGKFSLDAKMGAKG